MLRMQSGWAIKCLAGTKEKNGEATFIMVVDHLPTATEIAEACLAGGQPLAEVISVQRSVPLAMPVVVPTREAPASDATDASDTEQ